MDQPLASAPVSRPDTGTAAFSQRGAAAIVTLPQDGRAGDPAFLGTLLDQMQRWARSPEVYAIVLRAAEGAAMPHPGRATPDAAAASVTQQLTTFWGIDCLPKPILSLLDGRLTNPCIGLTAFVTHRAASETCRFVWPAAGDTSAPPLGGLAHTLARIPHLRGTEWALTGREIGSGEAWNAGLVTHCIARAEFPAIVAALAEAQPIDPILDTRHSVPALLSDVPDDSTLDRCFRQGSVADCLAALKLETGLEAEWAAAAAAAIAAKPTLALAGMQRLLASVRGLGRRDSLIVSCRLAAGLARAGAGGQEHSLQRAVLNAEIERLFDLPENGDLPLPEHIKIESGRF